MYTYVYHKTCLANLPHKYIPSGSYNNHWHNQVGRHSDHKFGQTWKNFSQIFLQITYLYQTFANKSQAYYNKYAMQ